jgi:hemerythrin-like domain-containing protein
MTESAQDRVAPAQASLKQVQAFQRAVEDHRFLSEYVANVQRSTELFNERHPQKRIEALTAFLAEHVIGHFAFEEKQVFPQLLARERGSATRLAVVELVDEHKLMRVAVRSLRRRIRTVQASGNPESLARLERSFRDFLGVLQAHAVKEDNMLLAEKQARRFEAPQP